MNGRDASREIGERVAGLRNEKLRALRERHERLHLRVSPETILRARELASRESISVSKYVERLIDLAYLTRLARR